MVIVYKSESLFKNEYNALIKLIEKSMKKCMAIMKNESYDGTEKAKRYLETVHLQETIFIRENSIEINQEKVDEKTRRMGKNTLHKYYGY